MPLNDAEIVYDLHKLPVEQRLLHPDRCQERWYNFVANINIIKEKTVLDAGAGTGYGLKILTDGGALAVEGFDPLPLNELVINKPIEEYETNSWDIVVAMDVIEHVQEDKVFLSEMLRIAKEYVFFSTPNWNQYGAENKFHIREYTPLELLELLDGLNYTIYLMNRTPKIKPYEMKILTAKESAALFGVLIRK